MWSCYPDLNWRPHPYQLTKCCCSLSLVFVPYRPEAVVPQRPRQFLPARCCPLTYLEKVYFLVSVSVLCRFLLGAAPPDLIPTSATLRPLHDGAGPFFHAWGFPALSHFLPLGRAAQPRRKACSIGSASGQSGAWGNPSRRFGISKRISPKHCLPTLLHRLIELIISSIAAQSPASPPAVVITACCRSG